MRGVQTFPEILLRQDKTPSILLLCYVVILAMRKDLLSRRQLILAEYFREVSIMGVVWRGQSRHLAQRREIVDVYSRLFVLSVVLLIVLWGMTGQRSLLEVAHIVFCIWFEQMHYYYLANLFKFEF